MNDWQRIINELLPFSYQEGAEKLDLFLKSEEGQTAMNLLGVTKKEVIVLRKNNDPNRNSPTFVLSGYGLNKLTYGGTFNSIPLYRSVSAIELFNEIARTSPDHWHFPDRDDLVTWIKEQLDTIAKNKLDEMMT